MFRILRNSQAFNVKRLVRFLQFASLLDHSRLFARHFVQGISAEAARIVVNLAPFVPLVCSLYSPWIKSAFAPALLHEDSRRGLRWSIPISLMRDCGAIPPPDIFALDPQLPTSLLKALLRARRIDSEDDKWENH